MQEHEKTARIRQAIRTFQYGLCVLTCGADEQARAASVTWVTQVSMRPRRVAVAIRRESHIYAALRETGMFALNVVGEGDKGLASAFFRYVEPTGNAFRDYPFEVGQYSGAPLLLDAVAWLECRVVEEANEGGDHGLFIADVLAGDVRHPDVHSMNLAATGWSYGG
ncbi:MAG: flavin reductase [Anaerolineae bacterium]|nr:flavin reductase [Anaerolineae bacterium]MCB9140907.1 flavin reductase [Anaerolineales bacterium]MCB0235340.1 flavin reductase [Anaerolineae bacterium]MCB0245157.1 flavin reductase [Anaerolineae bacterium]MCB0247543.1 flavin reductase [Anaerolineae bacterium]